MHVEMSQLRLLSGANATRVWTRIIKVNLSYICICPEALNFENKARILHRSIPGFNKLAKYLQRKGLKIFSLLILKNAECVTLEVGRFSW
jgi:hypothetical protein